MEAPEKSSAYAHYEETWASPSGANGLVRAVHGKEVRRAEKAFYERLLLTITQASVTAVGVLV